MEQYKQIVSLGYFCSPAMEFERIGRRQFSLPFDWLITPELSKLMKLIDNGFEDFLNEEFMFQLKDYPQYYRNKKLNIDFYHDFSPLKSFDSQICDVKQKYNRRIKRFYEIIKEPTLFLRYVTARDLNYISENYEFILKTLREFNPDNNIIFVANNDMRIKLPSEISMYFVEKEAEDTVSRQFLNANDELKKYISDNVVPSSPKKNGGKSKLLKKISKGIVKAFIKLNLVYRHDKRC